VHCWRLPDAASGGVDLTALLQRAAREGWLDVMVEGGRTLASELLRADLVDRVWLFVAPVMLGGDRTWTGDLGVGSIAQKIPFARVRTGGFGPDALMESWSPTALAMLRGVEEDPALGCSPD
jgi:diaminohydroxyphosphoribosylaminopyrimidine deaminase/5-amino-6-(5-phosphoribosylamino)uracil reductase